MTRELNISFIDAVDLAKSIKSINFSSVSGKTFVTESLGIIKKGLTYKGIQAVSDMAAKNNDFAVKQWCNTYLQPKLSANSTLLKFGYICESAMASETGMAMFSEKNFNTANEVLSMDNYAAVEKIATTNDLNALTIVPGMHTLLEDAKTSYYKLEDTKTSYAGHNVSHVLGVIIPLTDGAKLYAFDGYMFKQLGTDITPVSAIDVSSVYYADIESNKPLIESINSLKQYFDASTNKFIVPLSIGTVTISEDGLQLNLAPIAPDQLLKQYETYAKLHSTNMHMMSKLREDDSLVMYISTLYNNYDDVVLFDFIYKIHVSATHIQYLVLLNSAYYIFDRFEGASVMQLKKFKSLQDAITAIIADNAAKVIADKYSSVLQNEILENSLRSQSKAVYESTHANVVSTIAELEKTLASLQNQPFMAENIEVLTKQLNSLKLHEIELSQKIAELS